MEIGERIKTKRLELGLTQEELAKKVGYKTKSSINKIELGLNDITQSRIVKFANALNTTVSYLMGWDEEEIDAVAEMQADKRIYEEALGKSELLEYMSTWLNYYKKFVELHLTEEEIKQVYDYAEFIKGKRKE